MPNRLYTTAAPIRAHGQLHEGGHQHGPDQRGVNENGQRHANPQQFQENDIPERVRGEREGENARCRRDQRTFFFAACRRPLLPDSPTGRLLLDSERMNTL